MRCKLNLISVMIGMFWMIQSYALSPILQQCPSPDAIKYEGVHRAQPLMYNLFIIYEVSYYDTDRSWLFGVGLVTGESMGDAIASGNRMVQDISSKPVPTDQQSGGAVCVYPIAGGKYSGIAVEADHVKTPQELQRFFTLPERSRQ